MSDIPYHRKFGSLNGRDEDLSEYLSEMKEQRLGNHPWCEQSCPLKTHGKGTIDAQADETHASRFRFFFF